MPIILFRLMRRFVTTTWAPPAVMITAVFASSWAMMALAEPDSALVKPDTFWWWFIVTASTVGYGDFYPQTTAGRLVGAYVIVGGIATLTTLFARLAVAIDNAKGRRMTGTAATSATSHTVIVGYTPGRTERIITEVWADRDDRKLVLCAPASVAVHPMPHLDVAFVRGELSDVDTMVRAGVPRAAQVLIDVGDDNETLAILVTITHLARVAHIIASLHDLERVPQLSYVHTEVRCVQWHHPRMLAEELQDPGVTRIYTELMTSGGGNTYSMTLPPHMDHMTVGICQVLLGRSHGATLLAYDRQGELHVSPPWQQRIPGGAVLYYVARRRLTLVDLQRSASAAPMIGGQRTTESDTFVG